MRGRLPVLLLGLEDLHDKDGRVGKLARLEERIVRLGIDVDRVERVVRLALARRVLDLRRLDRLGLVARRKVGADEDPRAKPLRDLQQPLLGVLRADRLPRGASAPRVTIASRPAAEQPMSRTHFVEIMEATVGMIPDKERMQDTGP